MQRLEVVVFVTKRYVGKIDETWIYISYLEVYPFGKAYGGRPLSTWKINWDNLDWRRNFVSVFEEVFTMKSLLKRTFTLTWSECGFDPGGIDRVVVYKDKGANEVERLTVWERGHPIEHHIVHW